MRILFVGALAALLGSGCATITRGTSQSWTVETEPAGADVKLSSGETCKSPCTLKKKRKHEFSVSIAKDGYEPVETKVLSSVSGAGAVGMAGNVLVGGLIGVGIDAGTGATKDLKPNPLVVKLAPAAIAGIPASTAPTVDAASVPTSDAGSASIAAANESVSAPTDPAPATTSDSGTAD